MHIETLFNKEYQNNENVDLAFKQYRLYVEMADKISHRRAVSNSFFLAINTALMSLLSYLAKFHSPVYLLNVAGFILAILWFSIVRSYRNLNGAKYKIINSIERELPLRPYLAEWKILGEGKSKKKYWPLTHIEIWVPLIFAVIYAWPLLIYLIRFCYLLVVGQ